MIMVDKMTRRALRQAVASVVLALGVTAAFDATPVMAQSADLAATIAADAERRLQEEDDATRVRQEGDAVISDPIVRRELPPPGGPTVLLNSVTFGPASAFLTDAELDAIKARYVGRRVDFAGLSELVRDVNDLYAAKGVVTAAAILPPQDLANGDLVINLVEGQLGVVAVVGERQTKTEFITDRVRLTRGTTVDVPTAARDISFFNQTNRAQLRLLLQPGAAFGLTDLVFGVTEPAPRKLQFFVDNDGVPSTGAVRGSVMISRYGYFGNDDTLLLYGQLSQGSRSVTARYDFPITPVGTRLAMTGTASNYEVIAGPTLPLDLKGWSRSASATLTQPIVATDRFVFQATASAFQGTSASTSAGVPVVDARTRKFAPGVTIGFMGDNWTFNTQAQAVYATVVDNVAVTTTDYFILAGSFDGSYRFSNGMSLIGRGGWQHSAVPLLPGNLLFQIGGPTTVRGYPADGVAGGSGYYANLELHKTFNFQDNLLNGFVFADLGEVFSTFPARTTMASAGVGAGYGFDNGLRLEATVAVPLIAAVPNQSPATLSVTLSYAAF
jgi:hemolysin activation/secretion protein